MEVVHWLLRGRSTSNLQDDVRRWIHKARTRFLLDEAEHEVSIECRGGLRGTLVRFNKGGKRINLAEFRTEAEFEAVMADFFMSALSMNAITNWQANPSNEDDAGRAVSHAWVAFSGAMFIGTNYDTLLGDMPVTSGLNSRLIQMYIGVPWVLTLASAQSAAKANQNTIDSQARKHSENQDSKKRRRAEISSELEARRLELSELPSDQDLRTSLASLGSEFATLIREQAELEKRISRETQAEEEARSLSVVDRKELQTHMDSMAAGAIFRKLDPSCCPRCDSEISETKRKLEEKTHACSVCGEMSESDDHAEEIKSELEQRAKASKAAYDKAKDLVSGQKQELADSGAKSASVQARMDAITELLGSYTQQQALERTIAKLEGRLDEANRDEFPVGTDQEAGELKALS